MEVEYWIVLDQCPIERRGPKEEGTHNRPPQCQSGPCRGSQEDSLPIGHKIPKTKVRTGGQSRRTE